MHPVIEAVPLKTVSDTKQKNRLRQLYAQYRDLKAEMRPLEEREEKLKQEIEELMLIYDLQKVEIEDGAGLQLIPMNRPTISKDALLREGVEPAKIMAATKRSEYNVVKCWKAKEKE